MRKKEISKVVFDKYNIEPYNILEIKTNSNLNNVWIIDSNKNKYVLKVYGIIQLKNIKLLLTTLDIQNYMHQLDLAPAVIENVEGSLLSNYEGWYFSLQEFLPYKETSLEDGLLFSRALYKLHHSLSNYIEKVSSKKLYKSKEEIVKENREIIESIQSDNNQNESSINKISLDLAKLKIQTINNIKKDYNPTHLGVIHGDARPTNAMIQNQTIKFIDFDYAIYGDLMYEIGNSLILFSNYDFEKFLKLLNAYNECNHIAYSENEVIFGTLMCILQSTFPLVKRNDMKKDTFLKVAKEKMEMIKFCLKYLREDFNECKHSFKSNSRTIKKGIKKGNCVFCNLNIVNWNDVFSVKKRFNDYTFLKNSLQKEYTRLKYWDYLPVEKDIKILSLDKESQNIIIRKILKRSIVKPKSQIYRDGMQTPKTGNIIYVAQHALGLCCRKCLNEWYDIEVEKELDENEIDRFTYFILMYLEEKKNVFASN